MKFFREIYDYREMLYSLVKQDLRGRYKGSVLGFLWTFLNPLLQLVVYTFVFSAVMKTDIEDYYLFLFVAFVPWVFFSTSVSGGARSVLNRQDLVKKVYFPRQILPLSFVTSNFVNMLLSFIVVLGALLLSGRGIDWGKLWLLMPIMIIEYIFALAITMLTSAITVFFRDLEYILGIITMAWMYLTPIMYPEEMVPEKYLRVFEMNPVTPLVRCYRQVLYYGEFPRLQDLGSTLIVSIACLFGGIVFFVHVQKKFAEEM